MKRSVTIYVFAAHVLAILLLLSAHPKKLSARKPIAVRTLIAKGASSEISQINPPPTPRAEDTLPSSSTPRADPTFNLKIPPYARQDFVPEPPQPPLPPQLEEPAPVPPMPPPPQPVSKKQASPPAKSKKGPATAKKNPPTAQKSSHKNDPNKAKLISMMQNSLCALNQAPESRTGGSGNSSLDKGGNRTIGKLASEALSFEAKYEEELIAYLESILSFPEKGEVGMKLTLKREGSVKKVEIVRSSSKQNKSYIESIVAACSFPPFGKQFKGEESHTFTITLTSNLMLD